MWARVPLQVRLLVGSAVFVGALFAVPSGVLSRVPFLVFAPAVAVAAWISGNVHSISGSAYFGALVLEVYAIANFIYWASTRARKVWKRWA
jgi:hypothetical protein